MAKKNNKLAGLRQELASLKKKIYDRSRYWEKKPGQVLEWGAYQGPNLKSAKEIQKEKDEESALQTEINRAKEWLENPLSDVSRTKQWSKSVTNRDIGLMKWMISEGWKDVNPNDISIYQKAFGALRPAMKKAGVGSDVAVSLIEDMREAGIDLNDIKSTRVLKNIFNEYTTAFENNKLKLLDEIEKIDTTKGDKLRKFRRTVKSIYK